MSSWVRPVSRSLWVSFAAFTLLFAGPGKVSAQPRPQSRPLPRVTAEQAMAKAREVVTGRRACPTPEPGEVQTDIVVCGKGESARNRLSESDRLIGGVYERQGANRVLAPDPHQEPDWAVPGGLMGVSRLPKKWRSMGGDIQKRPVEPNAAYDQLRRAEAARGEAGRGEDAPPP